MERLVEIGASILEMDGVVEGRWMANSKDQQYSDTKEWNGLEIPRVAMGNPMGPSGEDGSI